MEFLLLQLPWIDYSTIPCMSFGTGPESNLFAPEISVRLRLRVSADAAEVEFQVASVTRQAPPSALTKQRLQRLFRDRLQGASQVR